VTPRGHVQVLVEVKVCDGTGCYARRISALLASLVGIVNVNVPAVTVCEPNV